VAISTSSGRGPVNADINVTPMADVMLVLLIIFMITAPLIAAGFEATMPAGINLIKAEEKPDDVVLGIDRGGTSFIKTRPFATEAVQAELARIFREEHTNDRILYLKAHQDLKMEKIQEAITMARAAGVRVIAAVADQEFGTTATVSTEREAKD
jgi:biopolymer transport protein TolR